MDLRFEALNRLFNPRLVPMKRVVRDAKERIVGTVDALVRDPFA